MTRPDMTSTERQLTSVLRQVAGGVRDETLRPLAVPARRGRDSRRWLAPVAAAVAVTLVTVFAVVAAGHVLRATSRPAASWSVGASVPAAPGPALTTAGPPRYYADVEIGQVSESLAVRATATGAVTATLPWIGPIAAAADDRTFYGAFISPDDSLYSFRLTAAGRASRPARVPGGNLGMSAQEMAVSPDGSQIALAGAGLNNLGETLAPEILIVNLRTGARSVWRGGLERAGAQLSISNLSWTRGGRSLVFLATWCSPVVFGSCAVPTTISPVGHDAELWALNPATHGGSLDSGSLVLTQSAAGPYLAQALISSDGTTIIAAILSGPVTQSTLLPGVVSVVLISVATGRQIAVLYRGAAPAPVSLSADPSGRYLLLADGAGAPHHGWISAGQVHALNPTTGNGQQMAW